MSQIPAIAILDVGKTNKKLFLFDEQYKIVYEQTHRFEEVKDEDGDPCEDLQSLTRWVRDAHSSLQALPDFLVKGLNFSAYGASFVHLNGQGEPFLPLYNYLKPYPPKLKQQFFETYGGEKKMARVTASPALGNLNSGLQLYRLKYEKELLAYPGYSLHLPQYLSYLVSGQACSDLTSIGCHTMLWDFEQNSYHHWVEKEGVDRRLAPILPSDGVFGAASRWKTYPVGVGLHDSSSALIPYLSSFHQPFVLISSGTWCISLNPFNDSPLTDEELQQDCLQYKTYAGNLAKASRLFAGNDHEEEVKRLAEHFNKAGDYYTSVSYDPEKVRQLKLKLEQESMGAALPGPSAFRQRDLHVFDSYEHAYHQLLMDIMRQQVISTGLVIKGTAVKRLFVDGGFGKNPIYMNLLALAFPEVEVYAASVAQATAMGAALAIHRHWNQQPLPADLIDLKFYAALPAAN